VGAIDAPVIDVVRSFMPLPHAFTLQCCHGHFLCEPGQDEHSLAPIPEGHTGSVRYRIAYVAFCLEDSARGRAFGETLARLTTVDPAFVQYGSADWFWERWPNSYTLQVEPEEHRFKDQAVLTAAEARHTQRVRDRFFDELRRALAEEVRQTAGVEPANEASANETSVSPPAQQKLSGPLHFGMGAAIGIGAGIGLVLGTMLGNLAIGLAVGAGLGTVAGAILESRSPR